MAKLTGKKSDLEKQIEKLSEKISKGDYKEKVPTKVQEQDAEKVGTPGSERFYRAVDGKFSSGFPRLVRSYDRAKQNLKR